MPSYTIEETLFEDLYFYTGYWGDTNEDYFTCVECTVMALAMDEELFDYYD